MPWHIYLVEFLSGALLANGVPHFVQGLSGVPFPTPFASPPGVGDSSPLGNALWGFGNLAAGAVLLHLFWPGKLLGWESVAAAPAVVPERICSTAQTQF
ncbi:MAG: hypothetical protein ACP5E5_05990 [Acidobacteriaceae bacterium]